MRSDIYPFDIKDKILQNIRIDVASIKNNKT